MCAALGADDDASRERVRAADAVTVREAAEPDVGDRAGAGHDREHEM